MIEEAAKDRFPNSELCRIGFEAGASWMLERLTKPITNLADIAHLTEPEQGSEEMNDEPTIIKSLEEHLKEYGHTTVGQDIAAAILVIRELNRNKK